MERDNQGIPLESSNTPSRQWAKEVVRDLLGTSSPVIWRGSSARLARIASMLPFGALDSTLNKLVGMDEIEKNVTGGKYLAYMAKFPCRYNDGAFKRL